MLFAMFFKPKAGNTADRIACYKNFQFPEGLCEVAWYHFPASDPRWLEIVEADNVAVLMEMVKAFDDLYEISVLPTETGGGG